MTFPPIPVSSFEDEAFDQLGAGSDGQARNGADAPARDNDGARDAALSRPLDLPHQRMDARPRLTDLSPPNTSPGRVSSLARPGKPSTSEAATGSAATASGHGKGSYPVRFLSLEMHPAMFTAGVWGLYALMALTAWRAVR